MDERSVVERVGILEQKVEALETLPARVYAVEVQILQLRDEMRAGFSAIRVDLQGDIRTSADALRGEIRASADALRDELRGEIRSSADTLREEIRTGDEETRRYMRVLHEEVLSRSATIGEARPRRKRS